MKRSVDLSQICAFLHMCLDTYHSIHIAGADHSCGPVYLCVCIRFNMCLKWLLYIYVAVWPSGSTGCLF